MLSVSMALTMIGAMLLMPETSLAQKTLPNPLGVTNVTDFIVRIVKFSLQIIAVLGFLFFVIGGFQLLTSAGNDEKVSQGKSTLFWAIVGMALALTSYVMIDFVVGAFSK